MKRELLDSNPAPQGNEKVPLSTPHCVRSRTVTPVVCAENPGSAVPAG